jgi:hypothetical protein
MRVPPMRALTFVGLFLLFTLACGSSKPPAQTPTAATPPVAAAAAAAAAADVSIKTDAIVVGGQSVVQLGPDRTRGADASLKNGEGNLFIVPLGDALKKEAPKLKDRVLIVDVDVTTPVRLLSEVLYTATQSEITKWSLRPLGDPTKKRSIDLVPPRSHPAMGAPDGLMVFITPTGISLRGRGGNVAPGCDQLGPGVAVPRAEGTPSIDRQLLRTCAKKVKDAGPDIKMMTVTATPQSIPFSDLYDAIDELRGPADEWFSFVTLAVRRPKD